MNIMNYEIRNFKRRASVSNFYLPKENYKDRMELLLLKRKAIIIMFKSKVLIVWCMIKQNIKKENIFLWTVCKSGTLLKR